MNTTKKRLLTVSISAALSMIMASQVFAAKVPDGVQLADKQVLVRNNGSEPQSLDPHKIEGVPESHLARDLFEGVVIVGPNGEILPGSATNWENKDFTVWTFHMRKDAK
ncbi:oligopeptide ABC transporter substrate-binding protein OppA, partial [Enterobacter hormaechei]|nr:oligopeptide ABC transporter substrate-binding protein OppA [Enterobacter hormaechei]